MSEEEPPTAAAEEPPAPEAAANGDERTQADAPTEANGGPKLAPGEVDAEVIRAAFDSIAMGGGVIPQEGIHPLLDSLGVELPENLEEIIAEEQLEPSPMVTFPEVCAVAGRVQGIGRGVLQEQSSSMRRSTQTLSGSNRHYIANGHLTEDANVIQFIRTLEAHKRRCEAEGKYKEATLAAQRLNELKLHEEAKLRMGMGTRQEGERGDAEKSYDEESAQHGAMWEEKFTAYESSVREQVDRLREIHAAKLDDFRERMEAGRPQHARPTKELLNQREIQKHLAKQGQYDKAEKIKRVADRMEAAEYEATQHAYNNECLLKEQQMRSKQGQEMEALLQRANRGRDELRITCQQDTDRRAQRFRNVMQELDNIQKLEAVQLEYFLEQQTMAGKRDLPPPPSPPSPPKTSHSSRSVASRPATVK